MSNVSLVSTLLSEFFVIPFEIDENGARYEFQLGRRTVNMLIPLACRGGCWIFCGRKMAAMEVRAAIDNWLPLEYILINDNYKLNAEKEEIAAQLDRLAIETVCLRDTITDISGQLAAGLGN